MLNSNNISYSFKIRNCRLFTLQFYMSQCCCPWCWSENLRSRSFDACPHLNNSTGCTPVTYDEVWWTQDRFFNSEMRGTQQQWSITLLSVSSPHETKWQNRTGSVKSSILLFKKMRYHIFISCWSWIFRPSSLPASEGQAPEHLNETRAAFTLYPKSRENEASISDSLFSIILNIRWRRNQAVCFMRHKPLGGESYREGERGRTCALCVSSLSLPHSVLKVQVCSPTVRRMLYSLWLHLGLVLDTKPRR